MPPKPRPLFSAGKRKKNTFWKTIVLVSLANAASDKLSSSKSSDVTYAVVTQIVVALEPDNCSPVLVAQLVEQQVRYDVILLDSKCFPILDNDTTRTTEYWKSTRKVLAASKVLYIRLKGSSTDPEKAKVDIDLTKEKKLLASTMESREDVNQVFKQLLEPLQERMDKLDERFSFIDAAIKLFECVGCM